MARNVAAAEGKVLTESDTGSTAVTTFTVTSRHGAAHRDLAELRQLADGQH